MRDNLAGAVWRLAIFLVVCSCGMFAMFAIFSQLRFQDENTYRAVFTTATGLKGGDFVRIGGVEVGKVKRVSLQPDTTALVDFSADRSVVLSEGSRAVIRYNDLIGNRYMSLEDGAGGVKTLEPGDTIPVANTEPALDLDALIGGFRPLFRALDPDQVNALSAQLIRTFEGQGDTVGSLLDQTAALTSTLADRDDLIGQVIDNLNTVLSSLGAQSDQFDKGVEAISQLTHELANRGQDVTNAVAYGNAAAASFADLLSQARPPVQKVIHETDRSSSIAVADHEYLDNLLNTLPDAYRALGRQGISGDFFSFYLCELDLKLNGKGGQPVYVKVAGQVTGRCAPR